MPNILNFNPQYPDLFLGAVENAGTFPNEKGEEVAYHNFLLDIAVRDREVSTNTVSSCGYECLGYVRTTVEGKTKFTDKRKVKADDISGIFGVDITTASQLDEKKFQNCQVLWDRKGNISKIIFEEPFRSIAVPSASQAPLPNEMVPDSSAKSKK